MEVAGDHIETASLNDGKEAAEAWVDKEVVFIVGYAMGHPSRRLYVTRRTALATRFGPSRLEPA